MIQLYIILLSNSGTAELRIFLEQFIKVFNSQLKSFTQRCHRLPVQYPSGFGDVRTALFRIICGQLLADQFRLGVGQFNDQLSKLQYGERC